MTKVMLVDDAAFMRTTLKMMLEKNGFTVVGEAENGKMALEKYQECKPDIVTMDITMPEMNGIQALTELRKIDPSCKVVMVSAMGQESMVKDAVVNGAKGFIVKPFKEDVIVKALEKLKVD